MFVDIIGASEVSNNLGPKSYANFVGLFQELFDKSCAKYVDLYLKAHKDKAIKYSARGDEGIFMAYVHESEESTSSMIDVAIHIALDLKRRWTICYWNKEQRINNGILPIDIAVGIHIGMVYLRENNSGEIQPEGYAINLAKRVESNSRRGFYTRILVSEAAHGALNYLPDERIYIFDEPRPIDAKGFSREVRAFEIKHHFLQSDWSNIVDSGERSRSRSALEILEKNEVETLKDAWKINPTNVWLAEDFIRSSMLRNYKDLPESDRQDPTKLRKAFENATETANYLAEGEQRDSGILMIQGLIEGECFDFVKERERYGEARALGKQIALLEWYDGYSFSNEAFKEIGGWDLTYEELKDMTFQSLKPSSKSKLTVEEIQDLIRKAKKSLEKAAEISPWSAWTSYTFGCEMAQWAENEIETADGVLAIVRSVGLLKEIMEAKEILDEITEEPYLSKVLRDAKIQKVLLQ